MALSPLLIDFGRSRWPLGLASACGVWLAVLLCTRSDDVFAEIPPLAETGSARELEFALGADLSFLLDAERRGAVFKDQGVSTPGLMVFRNHGYEWIRLRLFHSPDTLPNDLAYTTELAVQAKKLGYKFLLNFHYSDTWADPGKQHQPKIWRGQNVQSLKRLVREHTRDSIRHLTAAGAKPDMVQIGNEVISGMLWPTGRIPKGWPQFAELLKEGIAGVHEASPTHPPLVMLHIDRGGDLEGTKFFFDKCLEYGVEFDVIGQSYYPWWHGGLDQLRANFDFMANTYGKDIVLVEVAYNWRPTEYHGREAEAPFPETPEGQRQFLEAVTQIVRDAPGGRGKGVFWWEPAVSPGPIYSRGMFDDSCDALPVLTLFDPKPASIRIPARDALAPQHTAPR